MAESSVVLLYVVGARSVARRRCGKVDAEPSLDDSADSLVKLLGKRQSRRGIRLAFHSGKRMVGGPLKPEVATKHSNTPERGLP
jgi:hypothetical protein